MSVRISRPVRIAVEVCAVVAVPVVLLVCAVANIEQSALLSMLVVAASLALFFASFEARSPRLRDIMPTVVLAALAAAGRILFAAVPDVKPVSAIAIVAGLTFGRTSGFMVGALAALASNFFFGQGAWTPWQMYAWGMVGYGAGLLACVPASEGKTLVDAHPTVVYVYGFLSALGYGFIINAWSILGFFHAQIEGAAGVLGVYAAAFPFDVLHGVATVGFLLVLYAPWKKKLVRIKRKYGLMDAG